MQAYLSGILRTAAALVAALACSAGPVQAALYTGSWDPKFGNVFLNLSPGGWDLEWAGTYTIDADCPAIGSGYLASCTPPSALVFSASVTLSKPGVGGGATTLNFTPSTMLIEDLFYANDVVTKLKTDLSTFIPAPLSGNAELDAALSGYTFALLFAMDGVAGTGDIPPLFSVPAGYSGPVLYASKPQEEGVVVVAQSNVASYPPQFTGLFRVREPAPVPEPSGLALVASALLVGSLVRRRRRR